MSYSYVLKFYATDWTPELVDLMFELTGGDSIVCGGTGGCLELHAYTDKNNIIKEIARVVGGLRKQGWQCNHCIIDRDD